MNKQKGMIWLLMVFSLIAISCRQEGRLPEPFGSVEETLTIYTPHKVELYSEIIKEFEERTGIWVKVETGGTNQLLERIKEEAGSPGCDVIFGGGVESLEAYKEYFEPYKTSEISYIQESFCAKDDFWTPFTALPIVLIYNDKLVSEEELPVSWESLSDPYWSGKIAYASPEISGSCYTALVTMLSAAPDVENWEMISRFAKNIGDEILEDSAKIYETVGTGKYFVGITLEESAKKQVDAGDDVKFLYPEDGTTAVPDGTALIKNAKNQENGKLFIDFTVSREVQEYMVQQLSRRSVRMDVSSGRGLLSMNEIKLLPYDISWAAENKSRIIEKWKKLMEEKAP